MKKMAGEPPHESSTERMTLLKQELGEAQRRHAAAERERNSREAAAQRTKHIREIKAQLAHHWGIPEELRNRVVLQAFIRTGQEPVEAAVEHAVRKVSAEHAQAFREANPTNVVVRNLELQGIELSNGLRRTIPKMIAERRARKLSESDAVEDCVATLLRGRRGNAKGGDFLWAALDAAEIPDDGGRTRVIERVLRRMRGKPLPRGEELTTIAREVYRTMAE